MHGLPLTRAAADQDKPVMDAPCPFRQAAADQGWPVKDAPLSVCAVLYVLCLMYSMGLSMLPFLL